MNQRPNDKNLKKPWKWNNSKWWYCFPDTGGTCHGVHCIHKPSECKTPKSKDKGGSKKGTGDEDGKVDVTVSQVTIDNSLSEMNILRTRIRSWVVMSQDNN